MNRRVRVALAVAALLIAYLLLWPVPVDPVAWEPPPSRGLEGAWAPNDGLAGIEHLAEVGPGPEDMARGPDGLIYTGLQDGRIVRFDPDSDAPPTTFVDTGGRPLGMDFGADGRLFVADAFVGLLAVEPDGALTVLTDSLDGERMLFVNDLGLGADGKIYFTDSSRRFDQEHYMLDFIEGRFTGRLLSYDLVSGETRLLREGMGFANGVALDAARHRLWVAETLTARIAELRTDGSAGARVLVEELPGYPDNLSLSADGRTLWVAIPAVRPNPVEALAPYPSLRRILVRIPGVAAIKIAPYSMVIGLDDGGRAVYNLQDPAAGYPTITSVKEIDGYLYFGSIDATALGRMPLPPRR